ncbi:MULTISPECIES: TrkA family potassium uptake protein [unclassified Synechocystis]|uniref:potassium channel family protein n=1 Tax=unclassified Synechocystis TaxID=2640012 RepID=UPI000424B26D|nr:MULTISPECIES: TrkA family potassium uptake protein [unclassified Synechocystis]AIE74071.1 Trk system potassium uptake protein TrkA [Synechocystis sp. PCC 6714]MCT0252718.1 TrkA family potassium uptake protein [Synechocystis sp. CS-94]
MYILIGGMGSMGSNLAKNLLKMGHTLATVDIDPIACQYAREKIGVMAFEGSAVNTTVLMEAGIRKAEAVIATLQDDALNLALVTLCKHYGVPQIVVRMSDGDFAEPYRLAGATHIISTTELALNRVINAIEYPQVDAMMHFEQGQIEVLKLSIPPNCTIVGRSVAAIAQDPRFPSGTLIIGYQANAHEDLKIPNGNTLLEDGSTILAVTKPELVRQLINFMGLCQS